MKFYEELRMHIESGNRIINIITTEEERIEKLILKVAKQLQPNRQIKVWDCVIGFDAKEKNDYKSCLEVLYKRNGTMPTIYILKDFYRYLDHAIVVRHFKNLIPFLEEQNKTIILLSPKIQIPIELEEYVRIMEYPLPTYEEISVLLDQYAKVTSLTQTGKDMFIRAAQGLSKSKIEYAIKKALFEYDAIDIEAVEVLKEEKKQFLKTNNLLELCEPDYNLDDVGGLEQLKQWLSVRRKCFSIEAKEYGLPSPKGVLLMGVQGTGKSLCAKVISRYWRMPLLKLDIGKLMGSYIGESEDRTRQMIKMAEAMEPCIVWIDEIDKGFMGVQKDGDSGASSRVFGTLITWMQEKDKSVFIVATANDVSKLPPELLRKGRFDEVFFVDLPTYEERKAIFKVHLQKKRKKRVDEFEIGELAELTEGYSGAEIEQTIIDAMYEAFNEQREFEQKDIMNNIKRTIPLSKTSKDMVEGLRCWVKEGRARNASIRIE